MELISVGRLLAACVVVGLVLYALQAVGRRGALRSATATPGGRIVAILETTALPNAASLHVIRVAERYLLVARSASSMTTLCEIPNDQMATNLAVPPSQATETRGAGMFGRLSWVRGLRRAWPERR